MADPLSRLVSEDLSDEVDFESFGALSKDVNEVPLDEKDLLSLEEELLTETESKSLPTNETSNGKANQVDSNKVDPANEGGSNSVGLDRSLSEDASLLAKIDLELEGTRSQPTDLRVSVEQPEKTVKIMESFVTYRVHTQTTRSNFEEPDYSLRRRYNDFVWLRDKLATEHPTQLVPPLPEKHSMNLDKFDKDFVKFRERGLQRFLVRLAAHPVLSFDRNLQSFLTLREEEFTAAKKGGSSLLGRVGESLHTRSSAFTLKSRCKEHTDLLEYTTKLGEKLSTLEKVAVRLQGEEQEMHSSWKEWPPQFESWADDEDKLRHALKSMATAVNTCCEAYKDKVDETTLKMVLPLKEYQLYMDVIRTVLRRRDAAQSDHENCQAELNKRETEKEQLTRNAAPVDEAKKAKLEDRIQECLESWESLIPRIQESDISPDLLTSGK